MDLPRVHLAEDNFAANLSRQFHLGELCKCSRKCTLAGDFPGESPGAKPTERGVGAELIDDVFGARQIPDSLGDKRVSHRGSAAGLRPMRHHRNFLVKRSTCIISMICANFRSLSERGPIWISSSGRRAVLIRVTKLASSLILEPPENDRITIAGQFFIFFKSRQN